MSVGAAVLAGSVAAFIYKTTQCKPKVVVKEEGDFSRTSVSIAPPDDFHVHVRDGAVLKDTVPPAAEQFARAIIMPNLRPPVVNTEQALAYRERILEALHSKNPKSTFVPLMTLYLTDKTTPEEITRAHATGHIYACKLYPAGATTNSDSGVTDIKLVYPALREMARVGMLLLVHSEVTDQSVDIFDRERAYIDAYLRELVVAVPSLKIVMEHVTTRDAVEFVKSCGPNVGATITAHHLLYNRNRIFQGGLNPHYYCLPVLKAEDHRRALVEAATSDSPKFFAGTDSAPHPKDAKEACCGSAGCYTAHAAVELYAESFAKVGRLDRLEAFLSKRGANHYGLPVNTGAPIRVVKREWSVPKSLPFGPDDVVPLRAGEKIHWQIEGRKYD